MPLQVCKPALDWSPLLVDIVARRVALELRHRVGLCAVCTRQGLLAPLSRVYGNDYGDGDDDDDGNDYGDDDDDDLRAGIMALCKSVAIFAQPDPGAF